MGNHCSGACGEKGDNEQQVEDEPGDVAARAVEVVGEVKVEDAARAEEVVEEKKPEVNVEDEPRDVAAPAEEVVEEKGPKTAAEIAAADLEAGLDLTGKWFCFQRKDKTLFAWDKWEYRRDPKYPDRIRFDVLRGGYQHESKFDVLECPDPKWHPTEWQDPTGTYKVKRLVEGDKELKKEPLLRAGDLLCTMFLQNWVWRRNEDQNYTTPDDISGKYYTVMKAFPKKAIDVWELRKEGDYKGYYKVYRGEKHDPKKDAVTVEGDCFRHSAKWEDLTTTLTASIKDDGDMHQLLGMMIYKKGEPPGK